LVLSGLDLRDEEVFALGKGLLDHLVESGGKDWVELGKLQGFFDNALVVDKFDF
jgi:hypothetical protein